MVYNEKELEYIFARKAFKKHVFHNDNIEEEYYWDDYDTTKYYIINTKSSVRQTPMCPPKKLSPPPKIITAPMKLPKNTTCLQRPPVAKILVSRNSSRQTQTNHLVCDGSSQINPSVCGSSCNASSQTSPKFYFPSHRFNLNIEPFNTNLSTNLIL